MKLKHLKRKVYRGWRYTVDDIWDVELSSLTAVSRLGVNVLRVLQLVLRGFRDDECPLHASALTFSSLMSIVPILALSLALARGLGDEETLKNRIRDTVSEWTRGFEATVVVVDEQADGAGKGEEAFRRDKQDLQDRKDAADGDVGEASPGENSAEALGTRINAMVESGFDKVENISFKALGSVGLIILLLMVIDGLGRVEAAFNRIWGVATGRSLWRKFTDYLSVLVVMPFLMVAASSIPAADLVARFFEGSTAELIREILGSGFLKNLTVATMTALCFTFAIVFMPNTRVKFMSGLAGGVVSALLFIGWLCVCAKLQVGAARAGTIYGSFAIVPIILAWVYISWQIIFFGAEVAFAVQNCATYRMEQGARSASVQSKLILALSVVAEAADATVDGGTCFDASAYARRNRVPVRFLNEMLDELVRAGLMGELSEKSRCYVLLKSPSTLEVGEVFDGIVQTGVEPADLGLGMLDPRVKRAVQKAADGMSSSLAHMTIEKLLVR